jgi:hypothetical protein
MYVGKTNNHRDNKEKKHSEKEIENQIPKHDLFKK